jgi:hypothetical protein
MNSVKKASTKLYASLISTGLFLLVLTGVIYSLNRTWFGSTATRSNIDSDGKKQKSDAKKLSKQEKAIQESAAISFQGGKYEASGVIAVPGTDGLLLVDDSKPGEVLWLQLDKSRHQTGPMTAIQLGASIDDPEGITSDGTNYYIVGSQSKIIGAGAEQPGIIRFTFDPQTKQVGNVAVATGLREFLLEKVPELKTGGTSDGAGLDIEGIGFDPQQQQLMLGLRAPLSGDQALVIPIKLRDAQGKFDTSNFEIPSSGVKKLSLGGQGIRDIQYDPHLKSFLIIAGAPRELKKIDFGIWEWDAADEKSAPRQRTMVDKDLQPEGIAPVNIGGSAFIFVACDPSKILTIDY